MQLEVKPALTPALAPALSARSPGEGEPFGRAGSNHGSVSF
jgi:hypothetical protein